MGLLDNTRIFDTILTDEGRRQLGSGKFQPMFYSFSDAGAVYSPSDINATGSSPVDGIATTLTFEAFPLPQDQVAYEADDSGGLVAFGNNNYFASPTGESVRVISGKLVSGWELGIPTVLSASAQFASVAESVLSGTVDNFRRLSILKSPDLLYSNRDEFRLSITGAINFRVTNDTVLPGGVTAGVLESSEDMFSDRRLSHVDNFSFLPPINRINPGDTATSTIGNYAAAINGNRQIITLDDLRTEFANPTMRQPGQSNDMTGRLQRETVRFSETSITNRLMGQVFELAGNQITKLDVIDYGVFTIRRSDPPLFPEAIPAPLNPDIVTATGRVQVYFVGKVYRDAMSVQKFINVATLVFQD